MSAAEAWPTEDLATKAVDAGARASYERAVANYADEVPSWADLDPIQKLALRESVLPLIWAALTDLPDPRYAAWEEGRAAGSSDTAFESEGYGTPPSSYPHENPYPSGL